MTLPTSQQVLNQMAALVLVVLWSFGLCAQWQPEHRFFNELDGVSGLQCYDIAQRADGYIWTCTDEGIYKFNGQHWQHYPHAGVLQSDIVFDLHLDKRQRLWAVNEKREVFQILNDRIEVSAWNTDGLKEYPTQRIEPANIVVEGDSKICRFLFGGAWVQHGTSPTEVFHNADSASFSFPKLGNHKIPMHSGLSGNLNN